MTRSGDRRDASVAEDKCMTRSLATIALMGFALLGATGCGSAASNSSAPSSSAAPTTPAPAPPAHPVALVKTILPTTAPDTTYLKTEMESLHDQFAPSTAPKKYATALNAEARRSWLASGHSLFQLTASRVVEEVDVNLFKTTADATRIWNLERKMATIREPHSQRVTEHTPTGAQTGSIYSCSAAHGYSGCTLAWRQDATISFVLILGKGPSALNPGVAERLVPRLLPLQLQVAQNILANCDMSDGVLKQAA